MRAATSSRRRGGTVGGGLRGSGRSASTWAVAAATATTAASNAARVTSVTLETPVTLRTYCSAAARISSVVADAAHAQKVLQGELAQAITQQALTLAFRDVFFLMAGLLLSALVIVPFCRGAVLEDSAPIEGH